MTVTHETFDFARGQCVTVKYGLSKFVVATHGKEWRVEIRIPGLRKVLKSEGWNPESKK